ncbi:MAG: sulfatase [Phycisphaerales bacterium]|nr:sulfatase [Phycisphaerales bacterium]
MYAIAIALAAVVAAAPPRPNIVFIMSDDHGWQAISAYGSVVNRTPNIDRLAAEGMRFDRFFVTNALCGPSRAVLLTGRHSHANGFRQNGDRFDGAQDTFPKRLQAAGYRTEILGKWHLESEPTGFDHYELLYGQGAYYNPDMNRDGTRVHHEGYVTDLLTAMAIERIEELAQREQPFLLMVHHKAPHRNWQPGPAHLEDLAATVVPEPPTLFDDWSGRSSASKHQTMTIAKHLSMWYDLKVPPADADATLEGPDRWAGSDFGRMTPAQRAAWDAAYAPSNAAFRAADPQGDDLVRWKYQRFAKDYLRCVASVDDSVGAILAALDKAGIAENTLVVYTSDQGWFLGEHGWYDKRWMYEESFRTPLLVRWPGVVPAGTTNQALCQNLDFAPTFLAAAGLAAPDTMQGASLLPLLRGERPADWRDAIYYRFYESKGSHTVPRHEGVRTDRYKLIRFDELGETELFDLEADPDEMRSLANDPDHAALRAEMESRLEQLRKQYEVPAE